MMPLSIVHRNEPFSNAELCDAVQQGKVCGRESMLRVRALPSFQSISAKTVDNAN